MRMTPPSENRRAVSLCVSSIRRETFGVVEVSGQPPFLPAGGSAPC